MELYKKLYFTLFGKVEDALVLMDDGKIEEAKIRLLDAVEQAEETYMTANEDPTEDAVAAQVTALFLKTLHRLGKLDREAAISLTKHWSEKPHTPAE